MRRTRELQSEFVKGVTWSEIWPLYWTVYFSSDVIWFGNLTKDVIWLAFQMS